jgi:hypothetical protein
MWVVSDLLVAGALDTLDLQVPHLDISVVLDLREASDIGVVKDIGVVSDIQVA